MEAVGMGVSRRFERILLATDGSEESRAAIEVTIALAKSPTVKVRVAQVWNLEMRHRHGQWDGEVRGEAGKLVDATVEQLFRAGVIAEREICRADSTHVAAAIACAARVFEADLVVMGSRGLSDWHALTLNSETNQMLCGLDCPVVIVRGAASGPPIAKWKVLLAIAAGDDLEPGVRAAVAIGRSDESVVVVHVAQTISGLHRFAYLESGDEIRETMAHASRLLGDAGVKVQGVVAHTGPVTRAVAEIARDADADLIVVGSSRLGDIGSLFLGSLSSDLLHMTGRPALVAEGVPA
jgi:nucleotide-binding universal stress UspA family protein